MQLKEDSTIVKDENSKYAHRTEQDYQHGHTRKLQLSMCMTNHLLQKLVEWRPWGDYQTI